MAIIQTQGVHHITFVGSNRQAIIDFYQGVLGFDIIARMPTALFISAGGYHHHIGMNIWHSAGAGPAPTDSVRLRYFTIDLATPEALAAVVGRLDAAGVAHHDHAGTVIVQDPWQNTLLLQVGHAADVRAAAALESAADSR